MSLSCTVCEIRGDDGRETKKVRTPCNDPRLGCYYRKRRFCSEQPFWHNADGRKELCKMRVSYVDVRRSDKTTFDSVFDDRRTQPGFLDWRREHSRRGIHFQQPRSVVLRYHEICSVQFECILYTNRTSHAHTHTHTQHILSNKQNTLKRQNLLDSSTVNCWFVHSICKSCQVWRTAH